MPEPSQRELDAIVSQVVAEARIDRDLILPEEIDYIRQHVLKKPLRIIHIWALGVGAVIAGEYFGWNFGLPVGGPLGVLIASLIVCVLSLGWMILRALDVLPAVLSEAVEVVLVIVVWAALFFLLSVVGSLSTKTR